MRSPALPAIRNPMATSCTVVFHFASRVTGTLTRNPARYSRRPDTKISRHRMTTAADGGGVAIVMGGQNTGLGEASTGLWGMLGNTDPHHSWFPWHVPCGYRDSWRKS